MRGHKRHCVGQGGSKRMHKRCYASQVKYMSAHEKFSVSHGGYVRGAGWGGCMEVHMWPKRSKCRVAGEGCTDGKVLFKHLAVFPAGFPTDFLRKPERKLQMVIA